MSITQTYRVSPPLNKTYLSRTHLLTQLPIGRKKNIQSQIDQFSYCSNVFDYIIQLITKKKRQMKNSYAKIIIITHWKLRLEIWTWIIFCPMQNWPLLRDYKVEEERGDCGHGGVATGSKFWPGWSSSSSGTCGTHVPTDMASELQRIWSGCCERMRLAWVGCFNSCTRSPPSTSITTIPFGRPM